MSYTRDEHGYIEHTYAPTGETRRIKGSWGGKDFTDEELDALFKGDTISIVRVSNKTEKKYEAIGSLAEGEYEGKATFGFKMERFGPPFVWGKEELTEEERTKLRNGESIVVQRESAKGPYEATLTFTDKGINADFNNKN